MSYFVSNDYCPNCGAIFGIDDEYCDGCESPRERDNNNWGFSLRETSISVNEALYSGISAHSPKIRGVKI